ncbi:MAG: rod-binding protein [Lachnospiraceae bacterium]|nr:rod-binding protein [Lachnospiraceae bacterium]
MSSIDISGLSSTYSDILAAQAEQIQSDKLKNSVSGDYTNATDEELMDACKQFEAYFLEQMFKEMGKTVMKSESSDAPTSNLVDFFKDNALQELATQSTETNSLGLAQMLYEQMKRNYE